MKRLDLVVMAAAAWAAVSFVGCEAKDAGDATEAVAAGDEGADVNLPTEEDFEEAVEARITPATFDAELARLEAELGGVKQGRAAR